MKYLSSSLTSKATVLPNHRLRSRYSFAHPNFIEAGVGLARDPLCLITGRRQPSSIVSATLKSSSMVFAASTVASTCSFLSYRRSSVATLQFQADVC